MTAKDQHIEAHVELDIYCPKCKGTEYERIHIEPSLLWPEGWYYYCEFCNYTSEPE